MIAVTNRMPGQAAPDDFEHYLSGRALYGDAFDATRIAEWSADEQEGYAELGAKDRAAYRYGYRALNAFHGFRHLSGLALNQVLGFGGAHGEELLPIIRLAKSVTIVEPSLAFFKTSLHGVPAKYIRPAPSGQLPLKDDSFDLITCFGVLHHIPNVSFVFSELARVLKPGAYLLLREPIVSLGDWRLARRGLTKRERGIPFAIMGRIVEASGLKIIRQALCGFPLTALLSKVTGRSAYNSALATRIDALLSAAFSWNVNYHPRNALQRLRPTSVFLILRK